MLSWHTCLLLGSTSRAASIFSKDNCHRLVLLDSILFFFASSETSLWFPRLLESVVFHNLQGVFMEPVEVALFLGTKLPPDMPEIASFTTHVWCWYIIYIAIWHIIYTSGQYDMAWCVLPMGSGVFMRMCSLRLVSSLSLGWTKSCPYCLTQSWI